MAKVKMKTNRSAKKRFKITATGKIKRQKAGGSHYNTHKAKDRKRRLRKATLVHPSWEDKVKGMLKEF
ncbi:MULTISPECIES: 50S ribosomal protein L35 [Pampinifervens]|uniref:50S ribosomal protein L35 n=1 Tax=Pampinifervens TaxID=3453421 RepID=UPI0013B47A64|nr:MULTISPECIES: 50S ribosomal protein L35 [unclassified Hydrogenobacter]QID33827.1 50S ribosomal protein L35 [Hydrogenobacter sp. T-8]WPM31383.1 50S ribosomal protein L35 [Hydrogenobacter sp. T-2]